MDPSDTDFSKYFRKLDPETYQVFQTFNRLRTTAIKYGVQLALPEIVVVGMQSVGKSSLIEAFAGLRLNNCGYGTKTRRPLVLEMLQNDKYQGHPHCQFGHLAAPTSIDMVADVVIQMNDEVGNGFSSVPIQLKIEHCAMPNLVIVDTPGFQPENRPLRDLIRSEMAPPNRMIVCLESSKTAWEGFTFTSLVNEVDPEWKRTVVVVTKFNYLLSSDIMLSEALARQYLQPYFQGKGQKTGQTIIRTSDVFYIDLLPKREEVRAEEPNQKTTLAEYHSSIEEATSQVMANITLIPRDLIPAEQKIGFYNLKQHLEDRLKEKILSYSKPLQLKIMKDLNEKEERYNSLTSKLRDMESINYKNETVSICSMMAVKFQQIFNGDFHGLDRNHGQTLEEELIAIGTDWNIDQLWANWGCTDDFDVYFSSHEAKILGQPQYQRVLQEFEVALRAQELPPLTQEQMWPYLGNDASHDIPDFKHSVSSIVRNLSIELFEPIAVRVCERLSYFFNRSLDLSRIACEEAITRANNSTRTTNSPSRTGVSASKRDWLKYDGLLDYLQDEFSKNITNASKDCVDDMIDYMHAVLAVINFGSTFRSRNLILPRGYDVTNPTAEDTMQRVADEMAEDWSNSDISNFGTKWEADESTHKRIMKYALLNFASIRQHLTTSWRILAEKHFRIPFVEQISHTLIKMVRAKSPKQCQDEFFATDYELMKAESLKLATEIEGYKTANVQIQELSAINHNF